MLEPISDTRDKEDVLREIATRAPLYTPEWRYSWENPDAGTALAFIWGDMFSGVIERYNRVFENYRRALLDALGSEPIAAVSSHGYLSFKLMEGFNYAVVPKRSAVACSENTQAILETTEETVVTSADITDIFYVDPVHDACKRYENNEEITLFENLTNGKHVWTLSHPYAFDISQNATLRLLVKCSYTLTGADVHWQFKCGEKWHDFGAVSDEQESILLKMPSAVSGICTGIRFIISGEAAAEQGVLSAVYAFPCGAGLVPEAIYTGDNQVSDKGFYPFDKQYTPYNCLYLSCREALSKPGAQVKLSFDMRIEEIPADTYYQEEIIWKRIMRQEEMRRPERYEISITDVAWEYYNGTGWASLELMDISSRAIFDSRQQALTHYTVNFICPDDLQATVWGAHDAPFIRARVMSANNLFRTNSYYLTPWIERPCFRYYYEKGITIEAATVAQNLDSRTVSLLNPVKLARGVFKQAAICLAFDRPFSQGALLFHLDAINTAPDLKWEYYSEKGWRLLDIHDETNNLARTGLVAYKAREASRKLRLMGHDAWWIRIVDAQAVYSNPFIDRPLLHKIYTNAVAAEARAPGEESNLPANSYSTMLNIIAGIASAFNPLKTSGGCSEEDEQRIINRLTSRLNHGERAISHLDMEQLAFEASLKVIRCRCFPFTNPKGERAANDTCLVVVCREESEAQKDIQELAAQIEKHLRKYRFVAFSAHEHLHIIEPHYTTVNVELWGVVDNLKSPLQMKKSINIALEEFLNPITGGATGKGWRIGALPAVSQIIHWLRSVEGLKFIEKIDVTYSQKGGKIINKYSDTASRFALPQNGVHEIFLHKL